ncbi:MAG: hypothetical protein H0W50_01625 [Parachlamydiaceae bacterium]|nr:hypothetical protein [Parachlamydiaceae bacterium]
MDSDQQAICFTAAELLAAAIIKLFPEAQMLSGGANELGFYYDFAYSFPTDDLFVTLLEETMRGLAKEGNPINERSMMRENAADLFRHRKQLLKADITDTIPYNIINLVEIGDFLDVAPPFHSETTDEVGAFKIFDVENVTLYSPQHGSYSAIRIAGMAFQDKQQLKKFTKLHKALQENDHRILVKTMELFSVDEAFCSVAHSWLPKGVIMRENLLALWKQSLTQLDVHFVQTPHFVKRDFLKKKNFGITDETCLEIDVQGDTLLPVQTPAEAHALLFKTKPRYASEMPIRYAEVQEIQANAMPQTLLWGMLKTRSYLADFVHYFCEPEQLYEEIISSLQLINKLANLLGFGCQWFLSLNGRKIAGSRRQWDESSAIMERALEACGFDFVRNQQETTFAGPKIEAKLQDLAGRSWSGPEVGVDFHLPSRLELQYVQEDGCRAQPIMLRQSIFGPLERLVVLLIEKNGGVLPLWLAPEQVRIIAVSNRQRIYAKGLLRELQKAGCRATVDMRSDPQGFTLGARIHEVECAKVPYALIVGDQEEKEKIVNVRQCGQKAMTKRMVFNTFLHQLQEETTFQLPRD